MPEVDYTTIPDVIKRVRPHADVRLYGNPKCPHCKGSNIHRMRRPTPTGTMLVNVACPMSILEASEPVQAIDALRAYLDKELPGNEGRVRLNKSRKIKDKERKAFFNGIDKAMRIIIEARG